MRRRRSRVRRGRRRSFSRPRRRVFSRRRSRRRGGAGRIRIGYRM